MSDLWTGVWIGAAATAVLAAGPLVWAFRRYVLIERRARRAERLAELGTLTGGLAHEIKNPLSTIQLNLQLLQEDLPPEGVVGSRVRARLGRVRSEAARLRDTLDAFLRYAGRLELERQDVDLRTLVEEISDFFLPQAAAHRVELRVGGAATPVVASVDPKLVKQAVLNLLLNATQAMAATGGELMVEVGRDGPFATVAVTDTGPGIPADTLADIFKAYYSTKKGGTGLGLPMVRRIAEEHGGRADVASEVGKGSRFTLRFPVKAKRVTSH